MADETTRTCIECRGEMSPIMIMDRDSFGTWSKAPQPLAYRRPDDSRSFWTGAYPTSGLVRAFMCGTCGRISMYGTPPDA